MRDTRIRRRASRFAGSCAVIIGLTATSAFAQAEAEETAGDARTIIVTGSRIARPELASASPTQSVEPEAFVLTGVANVEQTLNQFPQLVAGFTNTSNNPGTGAATLSLRGLGSVRTLILVNGRRWIASDAGAVPEVDVNTIPAALIERVDIVTGGASAAYGSDAVTGVINFVLEDELDGLHLDARQSLSERGDARVSSADLSLGTGFAGRRGHLLISGGWLDQDPVTQADRKFTVRSLSDGCAVPGTRTEFGDSAPVVDPLCAPPNELALIAGGSATIPGSLIRGAAFFAIPGSDRLVRNQGGLRFDPDGRPRPFIFDTDRYNFAPGNFLQVGLERFSANLLADFEVAQAVTPFAELSWIETRSPQQLAPTPGTLGGGSRTVPVARINLDNPFLTPDAARVLDVSYGIDAQGRRGFLGGPGGARLNPAFTGDADGVIALPAVLQTRLEGLGPRQSRNRREATRGLVGVRGELARDWTYEAYFSRSRVEHRTAFANSGSALRLQQAILAVRDPATGAVVCIDRSNGCVPANIFGAGNLSAEAADFIRTHPVDKTIVKEHVAEASVQGTLAALPAGPAGLAFGAAWRRSSYAFTPDPALFTGDDLGFQPGAPAAGATEVAELFAEAVIPLLADASFAHALNLELGARYSDYDTVGGVWTWKALLDWTPLAGLRLRGGYQRAVRAPNPRELFEEPTRTAANFADPCSLESGQLANPAIVAACLRNGVPADSLGEELFGFPLGEFRGDPNLAAETASTLTIGAVIEPRSVPGLSLTLDYYDIDIDDAIGTFGGGVFVVPACIAGGADPADPLCAAYQRDASGAVASIDQPTANLPNVRARGIDWQLALRRRLGPWLGAGEARLDLSLSGTRYFENSFVPNDRFAAFDCAGLFGFPCGNTISGSATPRWKLLNQGAITLGETSLTLRHRWFSATRDARTAFADALGFAPMPLPEEGRKLESRHYFDLSAGFRLADRFDLTLGVVNLTDRQPAITGTNQVQANTDPSLYDVLGRRFFVALSAKLF